jgi:hypothetical protein
MKTPDNNPAKYSIANPQKVFKKLTINGKKRVGNLLLALTADKLLDSFLG